MKNKLEELKEKSILNMDDVKIFVDDTKNLASCFKQDLNYESLYKMAFYKAVFSTIKKRNDEGKLKNEKDVKVYLKKIMDLIKV